MYIPVIMAISCCHGLTRHASPRRSFGPLKLFAGIFFFGIASCMIPPANPVETPPPPPTFQGSVDEYYAGAFDKSIRTLQQLLVINPSDARARLEMARLYEEQGDYTEAISALRELSSADPGDAAVRQELFVAAVLDRRTELAKKLLPLSEPNAKTLFYEGLLASESGDTAEATALFRKSLSAARTEPSAQREPMAWYFLGKLEYAAGNYAAAVDSFSSLLGQDPNFTMAFVPLAGAMVAAERYAEAYSFLRRAHEVLPSDATVTEMLANLERRYPAFEQNRKRVQTVMQQSAVAPTVTTFPVNVASMPVVRVGLAVGLKSITIKTGGDYLIRSDGPGGSLTYHGRGKELLEIAEANGAITLAHPGEAPFLTWTAPAKLSYANPDRTTIIFDLVTGTGEYYAATRDRAYRGQMVFRPEAKGFTVINRVPLEEYLYSVVPSEMPALWPEQALEAQAVAARSYTLASLGRFEKEGFDVRGSVISAAYDGVTNEDSRATAAVNATQGQILLYHGKPLEAFYSANSGGYTENSAVVWGQHAGMAAVPDLLVQARSEDISLQKLIGWIGSDPPAYDATPPYFAPNDYRWNKWVASSAIERRVKEVRSDVGRIESITTRGRGISGRVTQVQIEGTLGTVKIGGDAVRWVLGGLRSNLFVVQPMMGSDGLPEYFIFRGAGWGHGVGMDQDGAAGMAAAGYTYREILAHYYPRAVIGTYLPDSVEPAPSASTESAAGRNTDTVAGKQSAAQ